MRLSLTLAAGLLVLSACAQSEGWQKSGASDADVAAAVEACQAVVDQEVAALRAAVANVQRQGTSGSSSTVTGGARTQTSRQTESFGRDELRKQERQIMDTCMTDKGFTYTGN